MKQGKALPVHDRDEQARVAYGMLLTRKWPSYARAVEVIGAKLGATEPTIRAALRRGGDLWRREWRQKASANAALARSTDDTDRRDSLLKLEAGCLDLAMHPAEHERINHHHHHHMPSPAREC